MRLVIADASCIALAQESENPLLLIDDRKARRVAEDVGIECVGCLGILLLAKREAVLGEVKPWLDKIVGTDFRLTNDLIRTVLKLAGE